MKRQYLAAIGFMVILALALLTRALLFLHPTIGDESLLLHVRFQNVDKISAGTRVTFAGKPVGEVKKVELLPEAFAPRSKANELIYPYELKLALDSSVRIYKSDQISVKTVGLMGENFIAIIPRPVLNDADAKPVGPDDILYASQAGSVEETFGEISAVAKKADETMGILISLIEKNQEGIFKATESIYKATDQLETFLRTINTGNGSLSKLLKDPELYDELTSSAQKANALFSDIHAYGMLFHLNRDWQRETYRRQQEVLSLPLNPHQATEQEFKKVSTAMRSATKTMQSIKQSLDAKDLSKNQKLHTQLNESVQCLKQDLQKLLEEIQQLNLEPDPA